MQSDQEDDQSKIYHIKRAIFGKEVEQFWDSDIGKYLQHRATRCYSSAIEKLKSANATDTAAIVQAQKEAWQAEQFIQWMTQAIEEGLESLGIVQGKDDADHVD